MIDLCFPKNNEQSFIKTAKELDLSGLCFVSVKKNLDSDLKLAFIEENKIHKVPGKIVKKPCIYYYDGRSHSRSYHHPNLGLTQVQIKELKEKQHIVCIPFRILREHPNRAENFIFLIKLCNKYKVPVFVSSFATSPYELRARHELCAVARFLKMNHRKSISVLENFLRDCKSFL
jgi:hypothetical protein